jgi:D-galactarolactone cycloisomerase
VWGSGIALSAGLHVCSALPLAPHAHRAVPLQNEPVIEFDRTQNPLRDDLLVQPFVLQDGYVNVPTGPGLGVEVNMEVVERYRVA